MSRLKIYTAGLVYIETIGSVFSADRREVINADNSLSFTMPLTSDTTGLINDTNVIELDGDYFDIAKYKKYQSSDGSLSADVECEHVSYRLNDPEYDLDYFTEIGTPAYIFSQLLAGTGFTAGTIEFTEEMTYSAQESMSRRALLVQFTELLGGELLFNGFTVSILEQRGSTTPINLVEGRNIDVISKSTDKTTRDILGNPIVAYECSLINPADIYLGDVVTMGYDTLGIDITLRIVSITTNPYNKYEASFSVSNTVDTVEAEAYRIATSTVGKDKLYNGTRSEPEFGFENILSNLKARSYFNATGFAMQTGDGSGTNWVDKLYIETDPETGVSRLMYDGELTTNVINAIKANIDVVVSNTVIVNNLYAQYGRIADLTVNELNTGFKKITNYLNNDTSDVNYIRVYDQNTEFITAATTGLETEHYTAKDNVPLYWVDITHTGMTTSATNYPVTIYKYAEIIKLQICFYLDDTTGYYTPKMVWGAGSGATQDSGKTFVYKGSDGYYIDYRHSVTGESTIFKITDDGIDLSMFPTVTFNEDKFSIDDLENSLSTEEIDAEINKIVSGVAGIVIKN